MMTKNKMKVVVKHIGAAFSVAVIPVLKDNYTYVIHDKITNTLAAVDVSADIAPVIDYVNSFHCAAADGFRTILSTHKHWDHTGGNVTLPKQLRAAGKFRVVGGAVDGVPGVTLEVNEGDTVPLGALRVDVLFTPCHTRGHVMYSVRSAQAPGTGTALFTGDTIFAGGIGAFFEGNAALMLQALRKVYAFNSDPADTDSRTFIFPGHEYTVNFLKFSLSALPADHPDVTFVRAQLRRYEESVAQCTPTVPSTLAEEKLQNLFLRTCDEVFVRDMNCGDTAEALLQHLYDTCP